MEITLQIGRDRSTGFPCIRIYDHEPFIAVFPITKLQVEQWIAGGNYLPESPELVEGLLQRMALRKGENQNGLSRYPASIAQLARTPLSALHEKGVNNLIATNLSLWSNEEELAKNPAFPTDTSEWGLFIKWLGAEIPTLEQWQENLTKYTRFRTKAMLNEILALDIAWDKPVAHLMYKYLQAIPEDRTGLPFMNRGFYELVAEKEKYTKLTAGRQDIWVPCVAGEGSTSIWPALSSTSSWRPVLRGSVPAVAVRPLFLKRSVIDRITDDRKRAIRLKPILNALQKTGKPPLSSGPGPVKLKNTVKGTHTMANRCPICYLKTDPAFFDHEGEHWCFIRRTEEGGKLSEEREHSNAKPKNDPSVRNSLPLNRTYLEIARKRVEHVRSITLSGNKRSGKTTWLLSMMGMLLYPPNGPYFMNAFPENWHFSRQIVDMQQLKKNPLLTPVEEIWMKGIIPKPTPEMEEALRSPIIFESQAHKGLGGKSINQRVFIINDIAGEIVANPNRLVGNPFFPHVNVSTDIIFIHPVHKMDTAEAFLSKFVQGLEANQFEGKRLNRKNINLIFCFSQIDWLKTSPEPKHQELLNILLTPPYAFPDKRDENELKEYFSGLVKVHQELQSWIIKNNYLLHEAALKFGDGSVRYCGFSSFGFEPITTEESKEAGAYLPFPPQPARVVDPLLWLLRDTGLIRF